MAQIFVVEDEREVAALLERSLGDLGYEVAGRAASGAEALAGVAAARPDLVLIDINIEGELDGISVGHELRRRYDLPLVFVTGREDEEAFTRARATEPYAYLLKPFRQRELRSAVEIALLRRAYERRLSERDGLIAATLRAIGEAVITVDNAGALTSLNRAAEELTGIDPFAAMGQPLAGLLALEDEARMPARAGLAASIATAIRQRRTIGPSARVLVRAGVRRIIEDTVAPLMDHAGEVLGAVLVLRDVSELRRLQQQVAVAERLASLGTLAAGIAHEINTPAQYIGDSARLLQSGLDDLTRLLTEYRGIVRGLGQSALEARCTALDEASDYDYLVNHLPKAFHRVFDGIERVSAIVKAVTLLGQPSTASKQQVNLTGLLRDALLLAASDWKGVAHVETVYEDLPPLAGFPGELTQVFLHLIVNAAQAIAARQAQEGPVASRGLIRVTAERTGGDLVVTVTDTGCGIPARIADRVFDPFFTTKPVGSGMGQGLAIARAIVVDRHAGALTFTSEPGRGTSFTVRLPLVT